MDERYETFVLYTRAAAVSVADPAVRCNAKKMVELRYSYIHALATHGIPVAPLVSGTTVPPKGSHGYLDASCDISWLAEDPKANFMIPTGKASGLIAIDIDIPNGFSQLQECLETTPEFANVIANGIFVRSPSGGVHVWLPAGDAELKSAPLPNYPQIEIKAERTALTGPMTWRRSSEKKSEGVYLPIHVHPKYLMEFLGVPDVAFELMEFDKLNVDLIADLQGRKVVKKTANRYGTRASARSITKNQATRWLQGTVVEFCELKDGHQRAVNDIVWNGLWLATHGLLDAQSVLDTLKEACPKVRYHDGTPRTSPYPTSVVDSVARSVSFQINQDIDQNNKAKIDEHVGKAVAKVVRYAKREHMKKIADDDEEPKDSGSRSDGGSAPMPMMRPSW